MHCVHASFLSGKINHTLKIMNPNENLRRVDTALPDNFVRYLYRIGTVLALSFRVKSAVNLLDYTCLPKRAFTGKE